MSLRGLVSLLLLASARGHQCRAGGLTCMEVTNKEGAPSTYGEYKAAQGWPMMGADGQELCCLWDHDYHKCPPRDGKTFAPCCKDGSNPHHGSARDSCIIVLDPVGSQGTAELTVVNNTDPGFDGPLGMSLAPRTALASGATLSIGVLNGVFYG
eukprot:gb/GFBE01077351.1/.p1 GENE.gb/GFBE01077351.1/~~gb/GFBE01077351.1/.p1  ORF type:complete len:154 (+),score=18.56 gb/GFBE01077351.1/:1-462(+)